MNKTTDMHDSISVVSRTSGSKERAQALQTLETEWAEEQQDTHSLIAARVRGRMQLIIVDELMSHQRKHITWFAAELGEGCLN